ncbi:hypothetical protein ACA910_008304 [Epithemia clementina (nom. ined.)]
MVNSQTSVAGGAEAKADLGVALGVSPGVTGGCDNGGGLVREEVGTKGGKSVDPPPFDCPLAILEILERLEKLGMEGEMM